MQDFAVTTMPQEDRNRLFHTNDKQFYKSHKLKTRPIAKILIKINSNQSYLWKFESSSYSNQFCFDCAILLFLQIHFKLKKLLLKNRDLRLDSAKLVVTLNDSNLLMNVYTNNQPIRFCCVEGKVTCGWC